MVFSSSQYIRLSRWRWAIAFALCLGQGLGEESFSPELMASPLDSSSPQGSGMVRRYVLGSSVNLRQHPDTDGPVVGQVQIGQQLTVLSVEDGVARVRTDAGLEGYLSEHLLTDRIPTLRWCQQEGDRTQELRERINWRMRARALAPWNRSILRALEQALHAAGEIEKAGEVRAVLAPEGPLYLGSCRQQRCRIWLEWDGTRYRSSWTGSDGDRGITFSEAPSSWYLVQGGQSVGWYTLGTRARQILRRIGRFEDEVMNGGFLTSRLLPDPIQALQEFSGGSRITSHRIERVIRDWVLRSGRAGWVLRSKSGATPVGVRLWPVAKNSAGTALAVEASYFLNPVADSGRVVRKTGVLFAWIHAGVVVQVQRGYGLFDPAMAEDVVPQSVRIEMVVDLDGDGVPEVVVTGGARGMPSAQGVWRAETIADRHGWRLLAQTTWADPGEGDGPSSEESLPSQ